MTMSTIIKLLPFIINKIPLFVSTPDFLGHDKRASDMLIAQGIPFDLDKSICAKGDIFLDCSANLLGLGTPRGIAELTQSGASKYKDALTNIPIISIDDSKIKLLEAYLGTGEGFVRAFKEKISSDISKKHFIILGCGKVGKGIVKSLKEEGCECTIIEIDNKNEHFAKKRNVNYIFFNEIEEVNRAIRNAYCIVTCTGVKNLISDSPFLETVLSSDLILTNMGAEDEYGQNFPDDRVANKKIALNFALFEPTKLKYLDPVFYAHNLSIVLFLEGKVKPGFNPFPREYDLDILKQWSEYWKEDISEILEM